MGYELQTALIGLVTGALGGAGTALVTLWAVDKRRQQRATREQLVKSAQDGIAASEAHGWGPQQFTGYERWPALRPHLPPQTVVEVEHEGGLVVGPVWTTSTAWREDQVLALSRSLPERYAILLRMTTGLGVASG